MWTNISIKPRVFSPGPSFLYDPPFCRDPCPHSAETQRRLTEFQFQNCHPVIGFEFSAQFVFQQCCYPDIFQDCLYSRLVTWCSLEWHIVALAHSDPARYSHATGTKYVTSHVFTYLLTSQFIRMNMQCHTCFNINTRSRATNQEVGSLRIRTAHPSVSKSLTIQPLTQPGSFLAQPLNLWGLFHQKPRSPTEDSLKILHWLPIEKRIKYKIGLLTFKCRNNLAPDNLFELMKSYVPIRPLRSSGADLMVMRRVNTELARGSSSSASSEVWNSLPPIASDQSNPLQCLRDNWKHSYLICDKLFILFILFYLYIGFWLTDYR